MGHLSILVEEQLGPFSCSNHLRVSVGELDGVAVRLCVNRVPIQPILRVMVRANMGPGAGAIVLAVLKEVEQAVPVAPFVCPDLRVFQMTTRTSTRRCHVANGNVRTSNSVRSQESATPQVDGSVRVNPWGRVVAGFNTRHQRPRPVQRFRHVNAVHVPVSTTSTSVAAAAAAAAAAKILKGQSPRVVLVLLLLLHRRPRRRGRQRSPVRSAVPTL